MREALRSRHMGCIIRAYRTHPHHGRKAISQETVSHWMGITQAQLSRTEHGMSIVDIDKLIQWADVLRIPSAFLWFSRPEPESSGDRLSGDPVRRSEFLRLGGVAAGVAARAISGQPPPLRRALTELQCAHWLALELWQRGVHCLHVSEIPTEIAASIACHISGSSIILRDRDDCFSFAHPSFIDFYLAQQIFGSIVDGDPRPFAAVQTTHETDLIIREFVDRDASTINLLLTWMRAGPKPVLRVNSGGVLAKLGVTQADNVLTALLSDTDMRQLYLTAVVNRVLDIDWDNASALAATVEHNTRLTGREISREYAENLASKFAEEIRNPRDAAARWCSVVMLSRVQPLVPDQVNRTLQAVINQETSMLTLRTIGTVLGGNTPIA